MKKSFLLHGMVLAMFVVLVSLGTWQVQRLGWKANLIERMQSRLTQSPVSLQTLIDGVVQNEDVEYRPVRLRGTYHHDTEKHLYTLDKNGRPGWNIYTLLQTKRRFVYVNRGFVPYGLKEVEKTPCRAGGGGSRAHRSYSAAAYRENHYGSRQSAA